MSDTLCARIAAGLGRAARKLGAPSDAYRPASAGPALAPRNRYMRLPVAFHVGRGFDAPAPTGTPLWQAILDRAYTKPGDYLTQGEQVWFIASQPRLMPVLCVQTNRVVSFQRPTRPGPIGATDYAGMQRTQLAPLLTDWPASVLGGGGRAGAARLPADLPAPGWTVLLPALPGLVLRAGDRMTDDLGRAGILLAAELSPLGWRLNVREVSG